MSFTFTGYIIVNPKLETVETLKRHSLIYIYHSSDNCITIQKWQNDNIDIVPTVIAQRMLYLEYIIWAGMLDVCQGHAIENGIIDSSSVVADSSDDMDVNHQSFIALLKSIGVVTKSGYFAPFDKRHKDGIRQ